MEHPELFITFADGKLKVNEQLAEKLSSDRNLVKVVSIVGKQRTGKSLLLSQFFDGENGFEVGHSFKPQTKGIWLWAREHPKDPNVTLVLLDTEGLDAPSSDFSMDSHILVLTALLSTALLFNIKGLVNESEFTHINSTLKKASLLITKADEHVHELLCLTFRDFCYNKEEYVQYVNGLMDEEVKRNIKGIFRDWAIHCLPMPGSDRSDFLNDPFKKSVNEFVADVRDSPTLNRTSEDIYCTTQTFTLLVKTYVEALNSEGKISITETMKKYLKACLDKAMKCSEQKFEKALEARTAKLPMEEEALEKAFDYADSQAHWEFGQWLKALVCNIKGLWESTVQKYKTHLDAIKQSKRKENWEASEKLCKDKFLLLKEKLMKATYRKDGRAVLEQHANELKEEYFRLESLGPAKKEVFNAMLKKHIEPLLRKCGSSPLHLEVEIERVEPEPEDKWYKKFFRCIFDILKQFAKRVKAFVTCSTRSPEVEMQTRLLN